jgi:murein DD-endopeptidase MepM/ murein hydrolase activator NlpD
MGTAMSQWSASRSQQAARIQHPKHPPQARAQRSGHDAAHGGGPRERSVYERGVHERSAHDLSGRAAYTLAHAGRQVRFGPVVFWIVVGTVVILAGWSIASATYLAFRDDVLRTLIAHQAQQQFAYEDRIAELRAQIDRTTSRQLLDQEQFEQKLNELIRRQTLLESRASALSGGVDPTTTGSLRPTAKSLGEPPAGAVRSDHDKQSSIGATLDRVEASLDRVERRQSLAVSQMENRYESKTQRIRNVLAQLGLKADATPATGGPFIPVKLASEDQSFGHALLRVNLMRAEANALDNTLLKVPLRKPVTGEIDETSPFGVRMDPFAHEAAMHTGIDFRGDIGEPIHATAGGTVTIAGWTGGYGKMVEIDHGNGLATRYGHLSEIDVEVGQTIRSGAVIGKLGSTGRSTGPHLHYETRLNGEPVNPQKFLDAGDRLFGG